MKQIPLFLCLMLTLSSCTEYNKVISNKPTTLDGLSVATLAGGCFWCMESNLEGIDGVKEVVSGFSGGNTPNPTYKQAKAGKTGHTETVQVYYDKSEIDYEQLLYWYWRSINPMDADGQFDAQGNQYRPAIFFHDEQQQKMALQTRDTLVESKRFDQPIVVEIVPFKNFYKAHPGHQDYYLNNPTKYRFYRAASGRDEFLRTNWKEDFWAHH